MLRTTASPTPTRVARIAVLALFAFACVSVFSMVGMATSARAADPLPVCSTAGEIAIQLTDGSARCVENTCEAVLGAEGRASECTQEKTPLSVSVPETGSGISGVAPVRAPTTAASSAPSPAADEGASVGIVFAWIFAGIGVAALLLGAVLLIRSRRERAAATSAADGDGASASPTASV